MRTRLIVGLIILALAVTASVMLSAAPRGRVAAGTPAPGVGAAGGPACPLGMGMVLPRLAKELQLTDAQIADLKKIHEDFLTATQTTREDLKAKVKEMVGLWMVDQPDATAIKTLAGEIDGLRVEIRNAGIDHMISALAVLTPAQREKLRTLIKEWAPKFAGQMGCGFGCGMGMGPGGPGPGRGMGMGRGPMGAGCPLAK